MIAVASARARLMNDRKSIEDLVLMHANLLEDGIASFRAREFDRCVELMTRVIDSDKDNWKARFYLAMGYYSLGDIYTGAIHFRYLEKNCPDADIRQKAITALRAMDRELKLTAENNFFKSQEDKYC